MNTHDLLATTHSQQLALTQVEDMEDYDTVKLLISNCNDVVTRAEERLDELLPPETLTTTVESAMWNMQFTVKRSGFGYPATWLRHQNKRKLTRCYTCNELVAGDEPRLRVRNGPKATVTDASHGVSNEYNCTECAQDFYNTVPPA